MFCFVWFSHRLRTIFLPLTSSTFSELTKHGSCGNIISTLVSPSHTQDQTSSSYRSMNRIRWASIERWGKSQHRRKKSGKLTLNLKDRKDSSGSGYSVFVPYSGIRIFVQNGIFFLGCSAIMEIHWNSLQKKKRLKVLVFVGACDSVESKRSWLLNIPLF